LLSPKGKSYYGSSSNAIRDILKRQMVPLA